MTKKRFDRRTLLRGAGNIAIGLPLLEVMGGAKMLGTPTAQAQDGSPKRFVAVHHGSGMGMLMDQWHCPGSENSWQLSPLLRPLERHKEELIVFDGLRVNRAGGEGHTDAMGSALTGRPIRNGNGPALGISIDQAIANHVGASTSVKSLDLTPRAGLPNSAWGWMSFSGSEAPVLAEQNASTAFNRVFGGFDPAEVANESSQASQRIAQRRSVLDSVMEDYAGLARRLGTSDRLKIDAHLSAIRDIEMRLTTEVKSSCLVPQAPGDGLSYPERSRVMMDLMVAALACDATRVATFNFEHSSDDLIYSWAGASGRHHKCAHNEEPNSRENLSRIRAWLYGEIAYLLDKLKEVPEVGGTLLDHSAVLFYTEMGEQHNNHSVPFHLAGSAGGAIRTNRLLKIGDTPHNNLLVALGNAFGLQLDQFGNPDWCTGEIDLT